MIYKDCQCYPRQITRAGSLLKEIEAVSKRIIVKFKESYLEDPVLSRSYSHVGVGGLFLRATAGGHKEHTASTAP